MRPCRLADWFAREEFREHRFDVEDWGAVDGVEPGDTQYSTVAAEQADDRRADSIRPALGSQREDADLRPCRIISRSPCTGCYILGIDAVEVEYDFDVRILVQSVQTFGGEFGH